MILHCGARLRCYIHTEEVYRKVGCVCVGFCVAHERFSLAEVLASGS